MKNLLLISIVSILLSGCIMSPVKYANNTDETRINDQYIEHTECAYNFGSFSTSDKPKVQQVIDNTIKKGNNIGMYGNQLINVNIQEGLFTGIIISKLCIYVKGNIVDNQE